MPLQTVLAMRTSRGIFFQPIDDNEITELLECKQRLHSEIQNLQRVQDLVCEKLSLCKLRLSDISAAFELPSSSNKGNVARPPINPRRNISSYFSVKYTKKMRGKDLEISRKLESEMQQREDQILTSQRKVTLLGTEIKDCALWIERHSLLNENQHCPFPFHQIHGPKSLNRDHYEFRHRHKRTSSHPANIRHVSEPNTTECSTCEAEFDKADCRSVTWRFAKLKTEEFPLRLRRSYSVSNMGPVGTFMENFADHSTGIFGNRQVLVSSELSEEDACAESEESDSGAEEESEDSLGSIESIIDIGEGLMDLDVLVQTGF